MQYHAQNNAFLPLVNGNASRSGGTFLPVNIDRPNIDGVAVMTKWDLVYYSRITGNTLTYEQILDYLSQEHEDDGEVRIYTNGRHPEIAEFVRWMRVFDNREELREHRAGSRGIYRSYFTEREGTPMFPALDMLSVEMLDELLKKEADPDYEMDLTSIQNRYIAEGRARVSEDGKTIEFTHPKPQQP